VAAPKEANKRSVGTYPSRSLNLATHRCENRSVAENRLPLTPCYPVGRTDLLRGRPLPVRRVPARAVTRESRLAVVSKWCNGFCGFPPPDPSERAIAFSAFHSSRTRGSGALCDDPANLLGAPFQLHRSWNETKKVANAIPISRPAWPRSNLPPRRPSAGGAGPRDGDFCNRSHPRSDSRGRGFPRPPACVPQLYSYTEDIPPPALIFLTYSPNAGRPSGLPPVKCINGPALAGPVDTPVQVCGVGGLSSAGRPTPRHQTASCNFTDAATQHSSRCYLS